MQIDVDKIKVDQYDLEQANDPRHWELFEQLQQYYEDNNLAEYWESKVVEEGLIHYDDVDAIGEQAFQLWLES